MEKNLKKNIYYFAVHLKLTLHCKSTIVQLKKKEVGAHEFVSDTNLPAVILSSNTHEELGSSRAGVLNVCYPDHHHQPDNLLKCKLLGSTPELLILQYLG